MSTPAQIVSNAKTYVWTQLARSITDAVWYYCLNYVYNDFYNKIIAIDKNYFWDTWTTDAIMWQTEYLMKPSTSGVFGQNKIEKIAIKWNITDEYFYLLDSNDYSALLKDTTWYSKYQPQSEGFFIISDNSIFIYPAPAKTVLNWLKFEWTKLIYDLTSSMAQDDILIPPSYHNILELWTIWKIYEYLRMDKEEQKQFAKYNQQTNESLAELSRRVTEPVFWTQYNLSYLD